MRKFHRWLTACNRILIADINDSNLIEGFENVTCNLRSQSPSICDYESFYPQQQKKEEVQYFPRTKKEQGISKQGGKIANIQTAQQLILLAKAGFAVDKRKVKENTCQTQ